MVGAGGGDWHVSSHRKDERWLPSVYLTTYTVTYKNEFVGIIGFAGDPDAGDVLWMAAEAFKEFVEGGQFYDGGKE